MAVMHSVIQMATPGMMAHIWVGALFRDSERADVSDGYRYLFMCNQPHSLCELLEGDAALHGALHLQQKIERQAVASG